MTHSTGQMRAAILVAPETIEVKDAPLPEVPSEGWSLVRCNYTGLCGTDFSILHGTHPRARFPLIMGHEISGQIERSSAGGPPEGSRVTVEPLISCGVCVACLAGNSHVCTRLELFGIDRPGSLAEYVALPNDRLIPLPDSISELQAALTEPLAVAVHAVSLAKLEPGSIAAVFGAGPIGMLTGLVARHAGAEVIFIEPGAERLAVAAELGFRTAPADTDPIDFLMDATGGAGADVVFDAAAHPSVAAILPAVTRPKGRIVLVGVYKKPAEINLQQLTFREVEMVGVRVYTRADVERAVQLIAEDALNLEEFPIRVVPLDDVQKGFDIAMASGRVLKVIVDTSGRT